MSAETLSGGHSVATLSDSDACAREPIHIPGSIQPIGHLFLVDPASGAIWCRALTGARDRRPTNEAFFRAAQKAEYISDLMGSRFLEEVNARVTENGGSRHIGNRVIDGASFDVFAYETEGAIAVECELRTDPDRDGPSFDEINRGFLEAISKRGTLSEVLRLAAQCVRSITRFDRVLIYRFEPDWTGVVVAEDRNDVLPSYLDLRFPASDIPLQARELYRINRTRSVTDANYTPLLIDPPLHPRTGRPIDLTNSTLRSVSPVHLQYMRNMGTGASMSISILRDGRLWGLISCHNRMARPVNYSRRSACDLVAQLLAIRIASIEALEIAEDRRRLSQRYSELLAEMSKSSHFSTGLVSRTDDLLGVVRAAGAAVITPSGTRVVGEAPSIASIDKIVAWLSLRAPFDVFQTDRLSSECELNEEVSSRASGLLAISISQLHDSFVLWFRPELIREVKWGGDPNDKKSDLSPRASFDTWRETVRGRSKPWQIAEVDAATELRTAIVEIVLRNAEELAAMNERLVAANKELEAFSYSVSHDLRAPFRHIVGFAQLLKDLESGNLSERGHHYIETIIAAAISAGKLVDDLLRFSQMSRVTLNKLPIDMNALAEEVREMADPSPGSDAIRWRIQRLPEIFADPVLMRTVLQNLIENALKFSRDRTPATVEIGGWQDDDETTIYVRDNGAGFDMAFVGKLFGVFQRLHRVEDYEGTGIGLANVRRIVERHGGRVWAEGSVGNGATFYFAVPSEVEPKVQCET